MKPASFVLWKLMFILLHSYEAEINHKTQICTFLLNNTGLYYDPNQRFLMKSQFAWDLLE